MTMTRGEAIRHLGECALAAGIKNGITPEEAGADFGMAMLSLGVTEKELAAVAGRALTDWRENEA